MAMLKILHYPDPRLRTVAKPVNEFDDDLATLVADMAQTMYEAVGIGLAATGQCAQASHCYGPL